jgi:hypothetical protein
MSKHRRELASRALRRLGELPADATVEERERCLEALEPELLALDRHGQLAPLAGKLVRAGELDKVRNLIRACGSGPMPSVISPRLGLLAVISALILWAGAMVAFNVWVGVDHCRSHCQFLGLRGAADHLSRSSGGSVRLYGEACICHGDAIGSQQAPGACSARGATTPIAAEARWSPGIRY